MEEGEEEDKSGRGGVEEVSPIKKNYFKSSCFRVYKDKQQLTIMPM